MRVFISYASENRPIVEPIVHSIRARGHKVFFDKHDLPAGQSYEERIEAAIARSDVFVFLVSSESVEQGGFARTELRMAEQKWPRPAGRVLPVMLAPTDHSMVPAYLRAVSILEPSGNIAAETAASVDRMNRFHWRMPVIAGAAVVLVASAVLGVYFLNVAKPDITIAAKSPKAAGRGYFGAHGVYVLTTEAENQGRLPGRLIAAHLVVTPPDALTLLEAGPEYSADAPVFVNVGATATQYFLVKPAIADPSKIRWRVCLTEEVHGETCSPEQVWAPTDDFSPPTAFPVPPDLSARAVAVARHGEGFVLLARNPGLLQEIRADGTLGLSTPIEGEPTAMFAHQSNISQTDIFVGTRGPNALLRIHRDNLTVTARATVTIPSSAADAALGPVSSTPVSIGQGEGRIWVVTRGGASNAGLVHFDTELTDLTVPEYYGDISFDLGDLLLVSNGVEVWGTRTNVTPASLYHFASAEVRVYSGHDYEIASCASGVLVRAGDLLVPDCDGYIQSVVEDNGGLQVNKQIDELPSQYFNTNAWTVVQMRPSPGGGVVFLVRSTQTTDNKLTSSTIVQINSDETSRPVDVEDARIVDVAAQKDAFIAILENDHGKRETVALKYQ